MSRCPLDVYKRQDYLFDKDGYSENQRGNAKARNVDSVVADDGRRKNYGKKHRDEQRS